MADAWRHESLTLETLRDVYANLNHAAPPPPAAAREEARRRAERAVAGAVFELGLRQCSPKVIQGLLARGGRRRRRFRVVQVRVYVSQCLHGQAVVPGVGHYHSSRSLVPFPCACTAPGLRLVTSAGSEGACES